MKVQALSAIFIFTLFIGVLFAQRENADSLISAIQTAPDDTDKVNMLNELGAMLRSLRQYDDALTYSNQAMQLAEQLNYQNGVASTYRIHGDISESQGDYEEAMKNYFASLRISEQAGNKYMVALTCKNIGIAYGDKGSYQQALNYDFRALEIAKNHGFRNITNTAMINIGKIYREQGKYADALEYDFQALKLSEELEDTNCIATILNNIGLVYSDLGNNDKALEYYFRALKLAEKIKDKESIAQTTGNIGVVYFNQREYFKALDYYLQALKIDEESGNKKGIQLHYGNIGATYGEQGDYEKALDYYSKSIKISLDLGDKLNIAINTGNIGDILLKQDKLQEAEIKFKEALALSEEIGDSIGIQAMFYSLSTLNEKKGNTIAAYDYYKKYIEVKEKLFNENNTKKTLEAENNYQLEKKQMLEKAEKDKEAAIAAAERKRRQIVSWSVSAGLVGLLLLTVLLFLLYHNRRIKNELALKHQVSDTELKALRSQMNPHFIFNALQSIQTFLLTHKSEDASTYLLKFSKLMRLVLENSQHSLVSLKDDLQTLELYMQLESIRLTHPFTYKIHLDAAIDIENATIPPLILQPFVENAIWHGLQHKPEPGHINIYISESDGALHVTVEDNGVGRELSMKTESPSAMKKESLGMKLTEERLNILNELKKIKAQFKITDLYSPERKPLGTKVELSLPFAA